MRVNWRATQQARTFTFRERPATPARTSCAARCRRHRLATAWGFPPRVAPLRCPRTCFPSRGDIRPGVGLLVNLASSCLPQKRSRYRPTKQESLAG